MWIWSFVFLAGCNVHFARKPENVTLRVYTDFLDQRDTSWIRSFEREQGVRVKLISAKWDSLDFSYTTDPFADLVVCSNMVDICELQNTNPFFAFSENPFPKLLNKKYVTAENDLFAIAKDPYVFYRGADSLSALTTYDELTYAHLAHLWRPADVAQKQLVPFVTNIVVKKKFSHADGWIRNFKRNYENGLRDSLHIPGVYFGLYSGFYAKQGFDLSRVTYPNQRRLGAINNYVCAGILATAPNYTTAKAFLKYMLSVRAAYRLRMEHGVFTTSEVRRRKSYLESRDDLEAISAYLLKTKHHFYELTVNDTLVNAQ